MDHVAKLKEAYREWNDSKGASVNHWMELFSDHIVFRSLAGGAPGMEFTKQCSSKEDVKRYFAGLTADWQMLHYTPEYFIADGDRVAVKSTCAWQNKHNGKIIDTPKADFFLFSGDQVVEFFEFYDTAKALAAASNG